MTEASSSDTTDYRDRSTLITVFGIFIILGGCLCALLVPLMFFGQMMAAETQGVEVTYGPAISAAAVYGLLAAWFIVLGSGALMKKGWAGPLLNAFAWIWLVVGVLSTVILMVIFGFMGKEALGLGDGQPVSAGVFLAMRVTMALFAATFYILLPVVLILVFGNRDVKATFKALDSKARWTDPLTVPVLALVIMLAFGGVSFVSMFAYTPVLPVFGVLITGVPAGMAVGAFSILWLVLAVGIAHLRPWAWWTTLGLVVTFGFSTAITFSRISLIELYSAMEFPAEQIQQIEQMGLFDGPLLILFTLLSMVPFLTLVIAVRGHYKPQS